MTATQPIRSQLSDHSEWPARPTHDDEAYQAITDEICERLAHGESLAAICREARMPDRRTVQRWCEADPTLAAECTRARQAHAEQEFASLTELENQILNGDVDAHAGKTVLWSRQWRLSKLAPRVYGDRTQVDVSGQVQHAHAHVHGTTDDAQELLGLLRGQREVEDLEGGERKQVESREPDQEGGGDG